jgi:hypothetical protein
MVGFAHSVGHWDRLLYMPMHVMVNIDIVVVLFN